MGLEFKEQVLKKMSAMNEFEKYLFQFVTKVKNLNAIIAIVHGSYPKHKDNQVVFQEG
jgi:hypothetical protein